MNRPLTAPAYRQTAPYRADRPAAAQRRHGGLLGLPLAYIVAAFYLCLVSIGVLNGLLRLQGGNDADTASGLLFMVPAYLMVFVALGMHMHRSRGMAHAVRLAAPFIIVAFLSRFWSLEPAATDREVLRLVLQFFISLSLVLLCGLERGLVIMLAAFGLSFLGSIGLYYYRPDLSFDTINEFCGLYQTKNIFGFAAALCCILCIVQFRFAPRRASLTARLVLGVTAVGCVLLVIICNSTTAAVCLVVGFAYTFVHPIIVPAQGRVRPGRIVAAFLAMLAIAVSFDVLWVTILKLTGKDPTLTGRTELWDVGIDFIGQRPILGHGFQILSDPSGSYARYMVNTIGAFARQFHNSWIDITFQLGFVGAALNVLSYLLFVRAMWLFRADRRVSVSIAAIGVMLFVQSFSEGNFLVPRSLPTFLLFIIVSAIALHRPNPTSLRPSLSRA